MPLRFFCIPGEEPREIVILEGSLETEGFFRFEHSMKDKRTNKWNVFTPCLRENANCAACEVSDRPSYFAMYLSIIDLTPYEGKNGYVEWSKKMLVIKIAQQKKFTRLERDHGSLRGMILRMERDTDKDAQIGNNIEFVGFMDEEELLTYEMSYEYTDGKGDKKVREIIGHEPYDFQELFPSVSDAQLRAIVGGRPVPGSREDSENVSRTTARAPTRPVRPSARRDEFVDDEQPPQRSAVRPTARPAASPAPGIHPDDSPDAGADPDPTPAPAASRRAAPPARRAPPTEQEEAGDDTGYEEDDPPAPPPRRAAPSQGHAPQRATPPQRAAAPQRRAQADPEVSDGGADQLAARRRMLRR